MSEVIYRNISPYGWGRSFDLTAKGHPIAKRVWRKKSDLEAYLNDTALSAVAGMIVVILDDDSVENNGAWLVERVPGDPAFPEYVGEAKLIKLADGKVQNITLSDSSIKAGVTLINDILDIPDMRTYWDETSF